MNTQNNFRKQIAAVLSNQEMKQLRELESMDRDESNTYHLKAMYADICCRLMLCTKSNAHRYVERSGLVQSRIGGSK